MTPKEIVAAIKDAAEGHHEDLYGGEQWYVDEHCIDVDAQEFWKMAEKALTEAMR
jgi:hypothetical protein